MECFDVTVIGLDKVGNEQFTRRIQMLAEIPAHLVLALKLAASAETDEIKSRNYLTLADMVESLFEAGN